MFYWAALRRRLRGLRFAAMVTIATTPDGSTTLELPDKEFGIVFGNLFRSTRLIESVLAASVVPSYLHFCFVA
jgi:hypothetical protein